MHILIMAGIHIIFALSYDLIVGYLGLLSLAHPAFYAVGAYTSTLLVMHLAVPFLVAFLLAGVCALLFALLIGYPAFCLSYHSFAIVTLAFTLMTRIVLNNWVTFTKGPMGIPGIPKPVVSIPFLLDIRIITLTDYYYLILVLVALTVLFIYRLIHSRIGRVFLSIRENEVLAATLGVNALKYKMIAFMLGAFFAGIAGAYTAHYITFISPDLSGFYYLTILLIMVIVGGSGRISGVVLGAIIFTIIPELLRITPEFREVIYGGVLLLTITFMPEGLGGKLAQLLHRLEKKFA
jgi:branched-chain amino acid transport system permease protein